MKAILALACALALMTAYSLRLVKNCKRQNSLVQRATALAKRSG